MEILFGNKGIYHYMDAKVGTMQELEKHGRMYQVRMLVENELPYILPSSMICTDAEVWLSHNTKDRNRMPNAAPALAPEDTPMISGDANGFRNTVWKTKPATPRTKPPIQPTIPRLARNVTNTCHCLGSPDIIPESVSG